MCLQLATHLAALSIQDLAVLYSNGNQDALNALWYWHADEESPRDELRKCAERVAALGNEFEADDLLGALYVHLCLPRVYKNYKPLRPWLVWARTLLYRENAALVRKLGKQQSVPAPEGQEGEPPQRVWVSRLVTRDVLPDVASSEPGPEEVVATRELEQVAERDVAACLEALPLAQRQVLELLLCGVSRAEIATRLGIAATLLNSRFLHGRDNLTGCLHRKGWNEE